MRLKIDGKCYIVKSTVRIRFQGIVLITLGCLCFNSASGAALFFLFFGLMMLFPNVGKLNRMIYNVARKIVRRGRSTIYYNK